MWNDIVIGTGKNLASAVIIFDYKFISQNSISYWISGVFLDIGLTIYKDTEEGKTIEEMINQKVNPEELKDFIISIIMKNIDIKKFKIKLQNQLEKEFVKGRNSVKSEIKNLLSEEY